MKKKPKKRRVADQLLQNLLDQIAAIDAEIDGLNEQIAILEDKIDALGEAIHALLSGEGDIESVMSDPHVQDAVRDWERRTGKKFDADADNAQDVLVAILASQQDEYGNDIAALETERSILEVEREGLVQQADNIRAARAQGAMLEQVMPEASEMIETVNGADILASELRHDVDVAQVSRRGLDKHSDVTTGAADAASRNEASFGGLSALLDNAGEDFAKQFQTASAEPFPTAEGTPIPENTIDVSMKA